MSGEGEVSSREWKETARWIKYEEDLEEGSQRWGKPYVATLSFYSIFKLRQLIERDGRMGVYEKIKVLLKLYKF